ncbi:CU044_5270 family protein [Spirillospora sp. NPDC048911]|uniref:CU044_5270 family protein n=1 Tax=Spirillospora sp. NPDC048911 TaxID=3364527 RepID=UPI0037216B4E
MMELDQACREVRPPSESAVADGRARLLAAARESAPVRRRPARTVVRLAVVGVAAATAVTGITVAENLTSTDKDGRPRPIVPHGPVANAAELLDRAAIAADARAGRAPRPDQWIYVEHTQLITPVGTRVSGPKTRLTRRTERTWWRADGRQIARTFGNGTRPQIENGGGGWKHHYPTLASLPADPARLADAIVAKGLVHGLAEAKGEERAATLYGEYTAILRNGVAPPKLEAAIFRAISALPGVTLDRRSVDLIGRPAITVGRIVEGYLRTEVMIDPNTYAYLGERIVVIKDHASSGTDGTWSTKTGAVLNLETRTASGRFVDRPGEVPTR